MNAPNNTDIEGVKKHITGSDDWGTSQFQISSLSTNVTELHFVAEENLHNEGDLVGAERVSPTNHWSLFLTTGPKSSIRVEAAPNDPGQPGMIVVENKNCAISTEITHKVSVIPPSGTTVASLLEVIIKAKRDYYIFSRIGEGCRFWFHTLAGDLAIAKIMSDDDAHVLKTALTKYWPYPAGTPPVDRPMAEGEFPRSKSQRQ